MTGLSTADRHDIALGRGDWVWADYLSAGGEWIDGEMAVRGKRLTADERAHHARVWADINCPVRKRFSKAADRVLAPERRAA